MDSFGLGFRISIKISRTADILPRFLVIRRWFGSRDVLSGPLNFISDGQGKRFSLVLRACSRGVPLPILLHLILVLLSLIIRIHGLDDLVRRGIG